jgi:hypothetical protein
VNTSILRYFCRKSRGAEDIRRLQLFPSRGQPFGWKFISISVRPHALDIESVALATRVEFLAKYTAKILQRVTFMKEISVELLVPRRCETENESSTQP